MIHHVLVRRYVRQSLLLWLSCASALFAFAWVRVWVVGLIDMGQFRTIVEQFRDFERFAPIGFDSLFTYTGRLGMTYDEPMVILCVIVWCIARGSDVVSGELGRGTLEMVLAQPVSRTALLVSHAAVSVLGLALLASLVWGGIAAGIATNEVSETMPIPSIRIPFTLIEVPISTAEPITQKFPLSERVQWETYGAATFSLFAFGFFVLGLSTMLSSMDRYRWRTVGAMVGIYVFQLVVFGLGKANDRLEWLLSLSFFNLYRPQKQIASVVADGYGSAWKFTSTDAGDLLGPVIYPLMLLAGGFVFYVVAILVFRRRDLPAPL